MHNQGEIHMRRLFIFFLTGSLFFIFYSSLSYAQLSINFVAVNPSETQTREIDIDYFLPPELEPDDILETGPLKLEFDVDKNAMYARGKISFGPKESKTFKIRVKDVWKIEPSEVDMLKTQLDITLDALKDDPSYESATYVRDRLYAKMDYILKRQEEFTGNIDRRIEEYRANITTLNEIRDNVYSVDFLKYESKGIQELDEMKGTVKMVIEVSNPSKTKTQTLKHKHFLPKEVRGEDILDKKDFELRFDEKTKQSYLSKEEEFTPGEVKRYEILMKDIWNFPEVKAQDLGERAEIAMLELDGTNFQESAGRLYEDIMARLEKIRASKALDTSIDRHIGVYRLANRLYDQSITDFKRIEEMISIVRAKKLQELERKKVKNVLERLKSLRGLQQLSEALFKRKISVNVTWKIIFGTLGFVAFFTIMHFFIWSKRSKNMGEEYSSKNGEPLKVVQKPGTEKKEEDES